MKPTHLYKFRSVSRYSLEALAIEMAWFSAPAKLNDPYDGQLPVSGSVSTRHEAAELASRMVMMATGWSSGRIPLNLEAPDFQQAFSDFARVWVDDVACRGVYSMTEAFDELLLWAHYGDSHQGFAIRHAVEDLPVDVQIEKVEYVDSLPILHVKDLLDDFARVVRTRYVTKGTVWKYEKEWRAISAEPDRFHVFPVDQIIFGHRTPKNSREAIRRIVGSGVRLFEAIPRENSFSVEIKPV